MENIFAKSNKKKMVLNRIMESGKNNTLFLVSVPNSISQIQKLLI